MYYCSVCGNNQELMPCADCGFDLSCCVELYPTLTAQVSAPALWTRRNALYEELRRVILDRNELAKQVEDMEEKLAEQERKLKVQRIHLAMLGAKTDTGAREGASGILNPDEENQRIVPSKTSMPHRFAEARDPAQEIRTWECECGCRNPMGRRYCVNCGNAENSAAKAATMRASVTWTPEQNKKWECDCGCRNPMNIRYCKNCGSTRSD